MKIEFINVIINYRKIIFKKITFFLKLFANKRYTPKYKKKYLWYN